MSNICAPCFNRIVFVVIHSYIELPWTTNINENYDFLTNTFIKIIIKKKFLRENHAPFVTDNLEKKFIPEVNKEMKFVKIVLK